MQSATLSSLPPMDCGIATYAHDLLHALSSNSDVKTFTISHDEGRSNYPIINGRPGWHRRAVNIIEDENPDVVHVQHEYGLYDIPEVLGLLHELQSRSRPTVMTFHTVYQHLDERERDFMSQALEYLSAGIVHCPYQIESVSENLGWQPKNLHAIPHGSKHDWTLSRQECKERLDDYRKSIGDNHVTLADKKTIGMSGRWQYNKPFHMIIDALPEILDGNDWIVLVGGSIGNPTYHAETGRRIEESIANSPVKDKIFVIRYKPVGSGEDLNYLVKGASDIGVMPYTQESQSGDFARYMATGTPVVGTDMEGIGTQIRESGAGVAVPCQYDWEARWATLYAGNFAEAICYLMQHPEVREHMGKNARMYVETTTGWDVVADETLGVYRSVVH